MLLGELQAYQAEQLPSGLMRYGAPAGQHDDTVMALAWQFAGGGMLSMPEVWIQFYAGMNREAGLPDKG